MWRHGTVVFTALGLFLSVAIGHTHSSLAINADSVSTSQPAPPPPLSPSDATYWSWFYRWHRGGAFVFHESLHPCFHANQSCTITDAMDQRHDVLRVNTTIIPQRAFVEVTYDLGDDDAHDGDFIGVYCVDQDEHVSRVVASDDFFDYVPINASRDGSFRGTFVVGPLVNMRCAYQFRYLRFLEQLTYTSIGESPHIEMEFGHSEPVQVHLALTHTPGEMRVTWTSGKGAHHHVHYGATPTNLSHHAEATTETYEAADLCSAPATIAAARWFRHPGYVHTGVMNDLLPGETYYYTVGSKFGIVSEPFAFTFPPLPGSAPAISTTTSSRRQSFFVFGDLGQGVLTALATGQPTERHFSGRQYVSRPSATSNKTVMKRIEQDLAEDVDGDFVAVVHVGDLSYAKGRTFVWDQFGALVEPVASRLPYMVAVGNHEYDYTSGGHGHDLSAVNGSGSNDVGETNGWHPVQGNYGNDSKGECGVPTVKRFPMPANGNGVFWYSFRLGLTHQIVLSSEHDCRVHSPMHTWLVQELQHNVNRTETPWLLVHVHRPLYSSENYQSDYNVSLLLRGCFEHVFMKHRVDVVFSGHYHAYERTCPVYKAACRENDTDGRAQAPIHIMVGSGGAELDDISYLDGTADVMDDTDNDDGNDQTETPVAWSLNRQQEYGYGRFHVYKASHARFEFVRARDRVVSDAAWIVSDHAWVL